MKPLCTWEHKERCCYEQYDECHLPRKDKCEFRAPRPVRRCPCGAPMTLACSKWVFDALAHQMKHRRKKGRRS